MATPFDPPQARPSIFPQSRITRYGFAPLLTGVTLSVVGVPPRACAKRDTEAAESTKTTSHGEIGHGGTEERRLFVRCALIADIVDHGRAHPYAMPVTNTLLLTGIAC